MPDQSGFEIKGKFYPLAQSFRLGDPPLVERVTGLDWPEFTERLPDEDSDPTKAEDIVVLAGLIAVSVWQQHPHWRRDRAASYVEQLELDRVKFIAADEDGADPTTAAETATPTDSPGESSSEASQE